MTSPSIETQKVPISPSRITVPRPADEKPRWRRLFARLSGEKPEKSWGGRFCQAASDMLVVCNQDLEILFHNRGFLRGVGYENGTYAGRSLLDFVPLCDRVEVDAAFCEFVAGRSAGMRIQTSFLTCKGETAVEARVTRTRRNRDRYFLYFVIRDISAQVAEVDSLERSSIDTVLVGLPVAGFRTDKTLRVTRAFGSLWEEFGVSVEQLVGAELSNHRCHITPEFLHQVDYCDTMAGQTFHSEISWHEKNLEVTVEPFVDMDAGGKVIGTLGLIRESKYGSRSRNADHLKFPAPEEYTQRLKIPRVVDLENSTGTDEVAQIRVCIQPRSLRPRETGNTDEAALAR